MKLGLKLSKVYESTSDIPERADEILKYNKALPPKESNMYTLEELMELIYLEGDIKEDEHVVIFDNACRGISSYKTRSINSRSYNSYGYLNTDEQKELTNLRSQSLGFGGGNKR